MIDHHLKKIMIISLIKLIN
jgi:hypothetical protein